MFKKKESVDVLDIPDLHRKKLIKLPEVKNLEESRITQDGFFDLSQNKDTIQNEEIKQETNQTGNFLSDFASIGSVSNNTEESDVKNLKWRIENLEFKLEQLIEKVNSINK